MKETSPRRIDATLLDGSSIEVKLDHHHQHHEQEQQHRVTTPTSNDKEEQTVVIPPERKVYYHEGATPLFCALEESNWREALLLLKQDPDQAQTWVVSTGTTETVFEWSTWKRLPLHEACRRQAPTWIVSALLQAYGPAASEATQFGELPLHLAVECSASPEVVNLLLVSFWPGIVLTDQSGRTPLQILEDAEVIEIARHETVHESLHKAESMWFQIQEQHEQELQDLRDEHKAGLQAIHQQHQQDLEQEHAQIEELLQQLQQTEQQLSTCTQVELQMHQTMDVLEDNEVRHKKQFAHLQKKLQQMDEARKEEASNVVALTSLVEDKNDEIASLKKHIAELQGTVQKAALFNKRTVTETLDHTQGKIQDLLDSFVDLHDLLEGHGKDLSGILKKEGVPDLNIPAAESEDIAEEKKIEDPDVEEDVQGDEAMLSAAMAASSVLNLNQ